MKKLSRFVSAILAATMLFVCASCNGGASVKVIDIALTDELYAFGVAKDDAELLTATNELIKDIKSNGKFEEILNNYFGDGTPTGIVSATEDSSKDQLVVSTNAAFAPFEYLDGDKYYGVDMEIMKLLADKLNKELVIKNVDFEAVCANVDNGYADIAAAGLTINEKRTQFVTFSDSYYTASQMLIVDSNDTAFDNCKTTDDVLSIIKGFSSDVKIGVQTGTTGQYFVEGDEDWGFEGFNATCVGYSNGAMAVQDLINGNIKYVMIDEAPTKSITASFNG